MRRSVLAAIGLVKPIATAASRAPSECVPLRHRLQRFGLEMTGPPLPPRVPARSTLRFQYLQVLGNRGEAHVVRLGEFSGRCIASSQACKQSASRGIGQCERCATDPSRFEIGTKYRDLIAVGCRRP
jgi:hypothetical protein